MFAWFFLTALYLQLVLGYSPLRTGLVFLPANLVMGVISAGFSARLVNRLGLRLPLAAGLLFAASGLLLLARAPVGGQLMTDILPATILLGLGAGTALTPVLLAATGDVRPQESGLASGLVNTAFMLGGALGLAILASIASGRTRQLLATGHAQASALTSGYHAAFLAAAAAAGLAALAAALLRSRTASQASSTTAPARAEPAAAGTRA
jgi:MFS family permease